MNGSNPLKGGENLVERKPIIKVLFMKPKEAYFKLSEEQRKDLSNKTMKDVEQVGGRWIAFCNCYWSNEEWAYFGVMEFPDIEAIQKHSEFIERLEQGRYVETKSYLGTRASV